MNQSALHGLTLHLRHASTVEDLTDRQEWLWLACISELEYRQRHMSSAWPRCACELCCQPFPELPPF